MKRHGIWMALAVVVLANLAVATGVIWNRAGEVTSRMTLTQRELPREWAWSGNRDNSGVALDLDWRGGYSWDEEDWWLGADKLRAIGFDVSVSPSDPKAREHYRRQLPRDCWVVLEYEGPAWRRWREKQLQELEKSKGDPNLDDKHYERERRRIESTTRLFAVDVGADPHALRESYPDMSRHLVLRGQVRVHWMEYELRGMIRGVRPSRIHVPPRRAGAIRQAKSPWAEGRQAGEYRPSYSVEVVWGARHEPWIESVDPIGSFSGESVPERE